MTRYATCFLTAAIAGLVLHSVGCTDRESQADPTATTETSTMTHAQTNTQTDPNREYPPAEPIETVEKSEDQWRQELSEQAFYVLREAGTERPFDNEYWDLKQDGVYACAGCGLPLFDSATKFESGTGWPSFYQPIDPDHVKNVEDNSMGMTRVENVCARCDGHLGHVFEDGPRPTGLRYCMNSAALEFQPRESDAE